jgi:hypothetical protein
MTRFFKAFLRDRLEGRVHAAVFGKHPAWDDHIDDIGLVTESLALAKRLLYLEGIAGQLASGAWDRIESSGQGVEFDHRFVWGRDEQAIIGAIWASSDGKGRARFPMVICIQAGLAGCAAIGPYLAPVERLGMLCKSATRQEAVREFHSRLSSDLNIRAPSYSSAAEPLSLDKPDQAPNAMLEALIALASGLKRSVTRSFGEGGHSACFRVPAVLSQVERNLKFWSGYLERRANLYNLHLPYLVIARESAPSIDLIIGEPESKDFFCLRANETVLPAFDEQSKPGEAAKFEVDAKEYLQSWGMVFDTPPRKSSWLANLFDKRS